jgi:hypothetical protein
MDMIGRCTTSVGEDHRTITRQVDFIPHWSKGNFGELWRVSRLVRETLSFSKKLANHIGAIKFFICHYNLTRAAT